MCNHLPYVASVQPGALALQRFRPFVRDADEPVLHLSSCFAEAASLLVPAGRHVFFVTVTGTPRAAVAVQAPGTACCEFATLDAAYDRLLRHERCAGGSE